MNSTAQMDILRRVDAAYRRHRGYAIGEKHDPHKSRNDDERLRWIDEQAPFMLLAHDGGADPRFIYVNATACQTFEYDKEELLGMPSRLSADVDARAERGASIQTVHQKGIVDGYAGIRVTKNGRHFPIERGELWLFPDEQGQPRCVAALVWAAPASSAMPA